MCLYEGNSLGEIQNSIRSINENSLQPNKIVLVVDGPLTEQKEETLIKLTEGKQYKIIWQEYNLGLIKALNAGLKHVDTEWCVRCDCDDYNHANRFQELADQFGNETLAVVGSYINETGWRTQVQRHVPLDHFNIIKFMAWRNPFNHMSVAFRTSSVKALGGYPDIYGREDYALWVMLLSEGWKMMNIGQNLVTVSAGAEMLRRRSGLKHVVAEYKLFRLKLRASALPKVSSFIAFILRSCAIIAPVAIKHKIWLKLRK